MRKLTFVTQNKGKIADAQKLLPDFEIHPVDFEVHEIQSLDLQALIEDKLTKAYEHAQGPCFVWDAGLFLDCLNGFPGPFIKFWYDQSVGPEKTCKIAKALGDQACQFKILLGYYDGSSPVFFDSVLSGTIPDEPRGTNGYAWDPIFIPQGDTRTFAEMTFEEKHSYTPQAKLLQQLKKYLDENN